MKTGDEIKLKDIVKLQELYINIFAEEDEDYPDYRKIKKKEQAKQRILDRITNDNEKQLQIIRKIRGEQKEIIEEAGGVCVNCDEMAIDIILVELERLQKEIEKLKSDN